MPKFKVPVEWSVYDTVDVEADTFEKAVKYVLDNKDDIPLGTEPQYIDDSYKICSEDDISNKFCIDENDKDFAHELADLLRRYGCGKEI